MNTLKHYPITSLVIIVIWIVCLIPVPETPLSHVSFIDKWTHFAMYGTLAIAISFEHARRHKLLLWWPYTVVALLLPCLMGGMVELAQAYLTNGTRSGDWLDAAANATGALIGFAISAAVIKKTRP